MREALILKVGRVGSFMVDDVSKIIFKIILNKKIKIKYKGQNEGSIQ